MKTDCTTESSIQVAMNASRPMRWRLVVLLAPVAIAACGHVDHPTPDARPVADAGLHYTVTVALAGPGVGTVTAMPGALSCPGTCSMSVDAGSVITLTATPAAQSQSKFVGWGTPSCTGTAPCVLPINGDQTITASFASITCGNGVTEGVEECDDGNTNNNDACTNACTMAECGDGFTWLGHEECDNGASNGNSNACTAACKKAVCGDGFTWLGHEECDDGASNGNSNACTAACQNARCGDGFTWAGHEQCDDGNSTNGDSCENDCTLPRCGNGIIDPIRGEKCDDGNTNNNDSCDNNCQCGGIGQPCCASGPKCVAGTGCAANNLCSACPVSDSKIETCQSGWPSAQTCADTITSVSDIITGSVGVAVVVPGANPDLGHSAIQSGPRLINFTAMVPAGDTFNPGKNTTTYKVSWCRF